MINSLVNFRYFIQSNPYFLIILGIWELFWKGIALWKAGRNNQRNWFIGLLVINTIGILPIIYLQFFQKKLIKKNTKI
jgi:hypothetical protein